MSIGKPQKRPSGRPSAGKRSGGHEGRLPTSGSCTTVIHKSTGTTGFAIGALNHTTLAVDELRGPWPMACSPAVPTHMVKLSSVHESQQRSDCRVSPVRSNDAWVGQQLQSTIQPQPPAPCHATVYFKQSAFHCPQNGKGSVNTLRGNDAPSEL